MSRMGERFQVLDRTAAALDVLAPELAEQFRTTNGLPYPTTAPTALRVAAAERPVPEHEIAMTVVGGIVRSSCSCGSWASVVGVDDVGSMVVAVRVHLGGAAATSGGGLPAPTPAPVSAPASEADRRAG